VTDRYIWQPQTTAAFPPKLLLDGFPKSGLHLIEQMVGAWIPPMPPHHFHPRSPWCGTFANNSWTTDWADIEQQAWKWARLQPGHYIKGHVGYRPEIEQFLRMAGVSVVFIYRDLRDVAVSVAHHWQSEGRQLSCEDKSFFRKMSFNQVLLAAIEGIGPYPGLIERWEQYAGWLDVDWVLSVKFEDARSDPKGVAEWLVQYGISEVAHRFDLAVSFNDAIHDLTDRMVAAQECREESLTFRRGQVGGWRDAFTSEHRAAFERVGGNDWLTRLGYEGKELSDENTNEKRRGHNDWQRRKRNR